MDVLGSPQLGTPRIMSKLMYSKLSKIILKPIICRNPISLCVSVLQKDLPSGKLTYPTLGKGKSSSKCQFGGYVSSLEGISWDPSPFSSHLYHLPMLWDTRAVPVRPVPGFDDLFVSLGFCCLPLVSVVQIQRSFRLDHFLSNIDMFNWFRLYVISVEPGWQKSRDIRTKRWVPRVPLKIPFVRAKHLRGVLLHPSKVAGFKIQNIQSCGPCY